MRLPAKKGNAESTFADYQSVVVYSIPSTAVRLHRRCPRKTVSDRSARARIRIPKSAARERNRVAPLGCSVAFSRRMLKALRLPWRPTTTAARCNYLKNARRSPILPPTTPEGGLPSTEWCKSCRVWTFASMCRDMINVILSMIELAEEGTWRYEKIAD